MASSPDNTSEAETLLSSSRSSFEKKSFDDSEAYGYLRKKKRTCNFASITFPVVLHLLLLSVYTTVFFVYWDHKDSRFSAITQRHKTGQQAYSPAWEALKWEPQLFDNQLEAASPFKGEPSPEMDAAWNELLGPTAVRVDKETLDKLNRSSVALKDGSGYMVVLDVYHQLHCLRYIKRYMHRDYYNMTETNLGQHIDHCLDSVRKYVMCNADVVLQTFDWIPNFHRPWPNFQIVHECANWDAIQDWAWAHSFDGYDPNLLSHPDLHTELPDPFDYSVTGNHA